MDYYGVRGVTHSWIKAFLSNQKQEVVLEGSHSNQAGLLRIKAFLSNQKQEVVLEGSHSNQAGLLRGPTRDCLGSTAIFSMNINNLPDSLKYSDAKLFVDDSLLYLTVNGVKENKQLQEDLSA